MSACATMPVLWDGEQVLDPATRGGLARAAPAERAPLYANSWAVVIGINAYTKWPKLSYAVNDATAVRDLLVTRFSFSRDRVILLLDGAATRDAIMKALGDTLADPTKVSEADRVVIFFAGHGITRRLPSGRELGYIVPVDADRESFASQAISMTAFQDANEAIAAKHILYLMDACYSGVALTRGASASSGSRYIQEVTSRRARQMLTAGGADEEVADGGPGGHSIFTWTLLQALEGRGDVNGDGVITASELAAYVAPSVSTLSRQTPAFGNLVGSAGGDVVFEIETGSEMLSRATPAPDAKAVALHHELENVRRELEIERQRARALAAELEKKRGVGEPVAERTRRLSDEGVRLFKDGKSAQALARFLEAAQLDPNDVHVGFSYLSLGDPGAAVPWLQKTIAIDPERAVAHLNLGDAYDELGNKKEAVAAWRRYLRLTRKTAFTRELEQKIRSYE